MEPDRNRNLGLAAATVLSKNGSGIIEWVCVTQVWIEQWLLPFQIATCSIALLCEKIIDINDGILSCDTGPCFSLLPHCH